MTIIIPARDDPTGLEKALQALVGQTSAQDEVIIVDTGREPISPTAAGTQGARVLRLGPAFPGAARNHGVRAARTPWVVFLDAGTEPVPGWLEAFRQALTANPNAQVLFGTYEPAIADEWDRAAALTYLAPPDDACGGRYPTTASICVRSEVWGLIDGMREDLRAGEDLLFFEAITARGLSIVEVPGARVRWDLPHGPSGHFRRLSRYSRATWGTSLARRWQFPLLRMYLAGLVVLLCAFAVNGSLAVLLPLLWIARLGRNLIRRRQYLRSPLGWGLWARVVGMALLVDAATLVGACAGALERAGRTNWFDAEG